MNVACGLLAVWSLVRGAESRCSPTSYYKNCWIRRFPGIFIDIEESQRRGAQLLRRYQEESALECSRTCCLTGNFSCNVAIFHYDATQENVNCLHVRCPALESCVLTGRGNVVLYNVTKGVDPDLLVFGKYFTSNVRVLPHHYTRVNASEPLPPDKRQFIHPPPPVALPPTSAPSKPPTSASPTTPSKQHTTPAPSTIALQTTTQLAILSTPSSEKTPSASGDLVQIASSPNTATPSHVLILSTPSSTTASGRDTPEAFLSTTAQPVKSTPTLHHSITATSQFTNSDPTSASLQSHTESSKLIRNDTKDRNNTAASEGGEDTLAGLMPGWHVAAQTLLVAVAVCITVLLSCCCTILLVVSWRGQRKRMGRYRTSWRGTRGSMRLIKYVLVKESS
ncbi:uncharacterized protein mansc4 [Pholidichthys leucotaenia]